jgi:uncharacterized protein YigE (DUF2233 family)
LCFSCLFFVIQPSVLLAEGIALPPRFITHIVDPAQGNLAFFWRDDTGQPYQNFSRLKQALVRQNKTLVFAMNAGIFQENLTPLGLYIEQGETQYRLSRRQQGYGNFYIQPNGVFYLTKSGQAHIVSTTEFKVSADIDYATQSGPMLLVDGEINQKFMAGSLSLRIRNGVGLLPDGRILFAMSKSFVSFYDFADYFKQQRCEVALYLDGSVSRLYLPEKNIRSDGLFGVIISEVDRLAN